jgi:CubicO group peptidase (beta-lactamase class C family)
VTGKSYREAVQERITSRLALNDTYVATSAIDVSKGETLAYQYFPAGWKQREETHATLLFSGGAIVSTPYDMVKFIEALFAGKLISPASLAAMKTMRDGEGMGMAPPFEWEGKTFYGETGGGDNRGAWLAYLPEEKLAIAYATNAKAYPVADIMKGIAAIYYGRPFEIPAWNKVEVSPETLKKYVGVYVSLPARFTISVQDSTLYVQPGSGSASPTEPKAENRFEITAGVTLEFDVEKNQMTLKRPQGERVFTREL